ncbi:FecR family protein [Sphingobacterium sp. HJSM2_6]|uniref:FecR family protein n=1 Tax=Sphingobacterium sp. HJSM2_6 TaxID=3366264 RepID=UPI003BDEFF47
MNSEHHQRQLIKKYLLGTVTNQERDEVAVWLSDSKVKKLFEEVMDEIEPQLFPEKDTDQKYLEDKLLEFKHKNHIPLKESINKRNMIWTWLPYAAALIVFVLFSLNIWMHHDNKKAPKEALALQNLTVLPGREKATLTLADGSTITLGDELNGELAKQPGVRIEKTKEGEILYLTEDEHLETKPVYNKVTTPNGGQYQITLPDGSKAWLNAASSLTYPVNFNKNERRVKMTGEVYFEVAKLKLPHQEDSIPFFVETDKQVIQVLGTQFNINAYADEPYIRTTLVEGSVRLTSFLNAVSVLLKPGQEAVLSDQFRIRSADLQQQLAWKNGEFVFKGEYLEQILKQIARWYDVKVECPARFSKIKFSGIVSRSMPFSTVIAMIESTKEVKISMEGRRLIVSD